MSKTQIAWLGICPRHGRTEFVLRYQGKNRGMGARCNKCSAEEAARHREQEARLYGPIKNEVCQKCFCEKANNGSCCCD